MRVLVTGGCGYIGINLVLKLIERKYQVRVYDQKPHDEVTARCDFWQGDIRDTALISQALDGIDAVIHLAAVVPPSSEAPQMDEINHIAACNLAHQAKTMGVSRFIFTSTCGVYGAGYNLNEEAPLNSTSPYAISKAKAENCILGNSFHPTVLRLATVFGPSYKMGWQSLFNTFVQDAIISKRIKIHDPYAVRPFVHVNDVAQAIILMLKLPHSLTSGKIFNVGGINCTKVKLASLIKRQFPETKIQLGDDPSQGYSVSFDRISRLGFKPEVSLEEGLTQFSEVYK